MKLENRVALITGAAGGIGLATAQRFVREGARVALIDLDGDGLKAATAGMPEGRALTFCADVMDEDQFADLVKETVAAFGGIDIFIANAGIEGTLSPIKETVTADFDRVMAVNVRSVWIGLRHLMPELKRRGGGSIVITSSIAGFKGSAEMAPYHASKHAVLGLMRCAALEGAEDNIRVNSVHPGPIETQIMDRIATSLAGNEGDGAQYRAGFEQQIPMHRYGKPEEVANMMLFLACEDSAYCTGSSFTIDGGLCA